MAEILDFYGVALHSVDGQLDTRSPHFRQVLTFRSMIEEEYSRALARKIHRGQEGRVLSGCIAGGRRYGYNNVMVEDASRNGRNGQPAVTGVRLEVVPEQAEIIRRIFAVRAGGHSPSKIAAMLTAEGIPSPTKPTRSESSWRATLLPLCSQLLGAVPPGPTEPDASPVQEPSPLWLCPKCGGRMVVIERLAAAQLQLRSPPFLAGAAA